MNNLSFHYCQTVWRLFWAASPCRNGWISDFDVTETAADNDQWDSQGESEEEGSTDLDDENVSYVIHFFGLINNYRSALYYVLLCSLVIYELSACVMLVDEFDCSHNEMCLFSCANKYSCWNFTPLLNKFEAPWNIIILHGVPLGQKQFIYY